MTPYLALHREFQRQDEDLVAFLDRDVVAAGFHLRNFQDNLGATLLYQGGLVIVFVVREEDRRNGILIEMFAGQGHAVVDLACGGRNAGYFRGILSDGTRRQEQQQKYGGKQAEVVNDTCAVRAYGSVLHPREVTKARGARIIGWTSRHGSTSKLPVRSAYLRRRYARAASVSSVRAGVSCRRQAAANFAEQLSVQPGNIDRQGSSGR